MIPIGLEAVNELLQQEVVSLVGARYSRGGGEGDYARWGRQQGSVYLGDHKVAVTVPRVRNLRRRQEVPLASSRSFLQPNDLRQVRGNDGPSKVSSTEFRFAKSGVPQYGPEEVDLAEVCVFEIAIIETGVGCVLFLVEI